MVTYPWGWKSTAVKVQTNCLWNSFTGGTCRNDDVSSMVGPGYSFSGQECVNTVDVIAFSLYVKNNISWMKLEGISLFPIFCIPRVILNAILCFHSRGQHLCKFIVTKESVCIRKEFNSHRTGLGHKHGRRFIVLGHKYGRHNIIWKHTTETLDSRSVVRI